ncbi:hypothetical protein KY332_03820 [Candidatus Woesearchaeota archaeon]|nr:hypothetical protein [Candidatus Woesearchaeota archaeon]
MKKPLVITGIEDKERMWDFVHLLEQKYDCQVIDFYVAPDLDYGVLFEDTSLVVVDDIGFGERIQENRPNLPVVITGNQVLNNRASINAVINGNFDYWLEEPKNEKEVQLMFDKLNENNRFRVPLNNGLVGLGKFGAGTLEQLLASHNSYWIDQINVWSPYYHDNFNEQPYDSVMAPLGIYENGLGAMFHDSFDKLLQANPDVLMITSGAQYTGKREDGFDTTCEKLIPMIQSMIAYEYEGFVFVATNPLESVLAGMAAAGISKARLVGMSVVDTIRGKGLLFKYMHHMSGKEILEPENQAKMAAELRGRGFKVMDGAQIYGRYLEAPFGAVEMLGDIAHRRQPSSSWSRWNPMFECFDMGKTHIDYRNTRVYPGELPEMDEAKLKQYVSEMAEAKKTQEKFAQSFLKKYKEQTF